MTKHILLKYNHIVATELYIIFANIILLNCQLYLTFRTTFSVAISKDLQYVVPTFIIQF